MNDDVTGQTEREYSGEDLEIDYSGGSEASWSERGLSNEDFDNSISGQMDLREEGDDIADAWLRLGNIEAKDSIIGNADLITSETNQLERFSHMSEGVRRAAGEILTAQSLTLSGQDLINAKASFEAALGKGSESFVKYLDIQAASPVTTLDPTAFSMKAVNVNGKTSYRISNDKLSSYRDSFIAQAVSAGYDTKVNATPIELASGYGITGNVAQGIGMAEREELRDIFGQTTLIRQPSIMGTFSPMASKQESVIARGMLESVESYEALGPGAKVAGNLLANVKSGAFGNIEGHYDDDFDRSGGDDKKVARDKTLKANRDFALAMGYISDLAELYIDPRTKGGEMYGKQKKAVELALTKRFLDGQYSDESKSILPLPNETGVTGLMTTRGSIGGVQGTPFTRLEFGLEAHKRGWTAEGAHLKEDQENPYWRYLGTVGQSLFPKKFLKFADGEVDVEGNAANTRERKHQESQAMHKARRARDILLEQMPTLRDETAGQKRSPGFDKAYGDQENVQHALDEIARGMKHEANLQGIDYSDPNLLYEIESIKEMQEDMQSLMPSNRVGPTNMEGIEQRTPAWYKAREGLITASKLTNANGALQDAGGIAAQLALEKFAKTDSELAEELEFIGTSHVRDGVYGEKLALREFLIMQRSAGDSLVHTEVGLLQNKKLEGFGASPDGRLKDADGNNRGLLELKYLTSGSMAGALKKYMPQMQLQMAVAMEEETNFFALDKFTGESIHEVVKADPDMQAEILREGRLALEQAKTLTKDEARKLKKQTKSERRKESSLERENIAGTGQSSSYQAKDYEEEAMTSFSSHDVDKVNKRSFEQDKTKAIKRKFESVAAMREFDESVSSAAEAAKKDTASNKAASTATKDREKADRDAAKATTELRNAAIGASKSLLSIALGAKDSSMDTINLARRNGFDEAAVRGQEYAMTAEGGLPLQVSKKIIDDAGATLRKLRTDTTAGAELTRMNMQYGSNREITDTLGQMKGREELINLGSDFAPFVQGEMNKFPVGSPFRATVAEAYGLDPRFAASTATMEEMQTSRKMNVGGNEKFNQGYQEGNFFGRKVAEDLTAMSGRGGGVALSLGEAAKDNASIVAWAAENWTAAGYAAAGTVALVTAYNLANPDSAVTIDDTVAQPSDNFRSLLNKSGKTESSINSNLPKTDLSSGYTKIRKSAEVFSDPIDASIPKPQLDSMVPETRIPYSRSPLTLLPTPVLNNIEVVVNNNKDEVEVLTTVDGDEQVDRESRYST